MTGRLMKVIGTAVALGACAPARLAVPAPLAATPRLVVNGRQGDQRATTLTFGAWRVSDVRRSWVSGSGLEVSSGRVGLDLDRATQRYAFRVAEGSAGAWEGTCAVHVRHDGVVLPVGTLATEEHSRLECRIVPSGGPAWTLVTHGRYDRMPEGLLTRGEDTLHVAGLDRFVGAVPTRGLLAGWVIRAGRAPVAAVEVANGGAVWMDPPQDRDYRRAIGAAAAALLLHEDVREVVGGRAGGL